MAFWHKKEVWYLAKEDLTDGENPERVVILPSKETDTHYVTASGKKIPKKGNRLFENGVEASLFVLSCLGEKILEGERKEKDILEQIDIFKSLKGE